MKTLNSKSGSLVPAIQILDEEEEYPCWYAELRRGDAKKKYKWVVGKKFSGETDEYSFGVTSAGDIKDDSVWEKLTSSDFAVELIKQFKSGGENRVKKWIKNGVDFP